MHEYNSAEKSLLEELEILREEVTRLNKLLQDEETAEEASESLQNLADTPNTHMSTTISLLHFSDENDKMIQAHGELIVEWKIVRGVKSPVITEVALVNSTHTDIVEVPVTKNDPKTSALWDIAVSQIEYIVDTRDYRSHDVPVEPPC